MEFELKLQELKSNSVNNIITGEFIEYINYLNEVGKFELVLAGVEYAEAYYKSDLRLLIAKCWALRQLGNWNKLYIVSNNYMYTYPGQDIFKFYTALAASVLGLQSTVFDICYNIDKSSEYYRDALILSDRIGGTHPDLVYTRDKFKLFNPKFTGLNLINSNYAQCMQDMFVLTELGIAPQTYLEFGAADPIIHSNTKLLEELGWKGDSIEYDKDYVRKFSDIRSNQIHYGDALRFEFSRLITKYPNKIIDYLQVDLDPADVTLKVLENCLRSGFRFKVITFEHDAYVFGDEVRSRSRELMRLNGYTLVAANVGMCKEMPFEDWYIDATLVENKLPSHVGVGDVNTVDDIFYGQRVSM